MNRGFTKSLFILLFMIILATSFVSAGWLSDLFVGKGNYITGNVVGSEGASCVMDADCGNGFFCEGQNLLCLSKYIPELGKITNNCSVGAEERPGVCKADFSETSLKAINSTVPRIAYWWGKVNKHIDLTTGKWETDADGVSGADLDMVEYCKKFYINTASVEKYNSEKIYDWKERGNRNSYVNTVDTFKCVQGAPPECRMDSDCSAGKFCSRELTCKTPVPSCLDTDNGITPNVKGFVGNSELTVQFFVKRRLDYCVTNPKIEGNKIFENGIDHQGGLGSADGCTGSNCYLIEYFCGADKYYSFKGYACENCVNGSCASPGRVFEAGGIGVNTNTATNVPPTICNSTSCGTGKVCNPTTKLCEASPTTPPTTCSPACRPGIEVCNLTSLKCEAKPICSPACEPGESVCNATGQCESLKVNSTVVNNTGVNSSSTNSTNVCTIDSNCTEGVCLDGACVECKPLENTAEGNINCDDRELCHVIDNICVDVFSENTTNEILPPSLTNVELSLGSIKSMVIPERDVGKLNIEIKAKGIVSGEGQEVKLKIWESDGMFGQDDFVKEIRGTIIEGKVNELWTFSETDWVNGKDKITSEFYVVMIVSGSDEEIISPKLNIKIEEDVCNNDCVDGYICDQLTKECVLFDEGYETSCTDSDGGKEYYIKGLRTSEEGIFEDTCRMSEAISENVPNVKSGAYLLEGFCEMKEYTTGNKLEIDAEFYKCPNGCSDGVCVEDSISNKVSPECVKDSDCDFGNECKLEKCVRKQLSQCEDNDGGENIFKKGYTTNFNRDYEVGMKTDYCIKNPVMPLAGRSVISDESKKVNSCNGENCFLIEYVCEEETGYPYVGVACENGCNDGACIGGSWSEWEYKGANLWDNGGYTDNCYSADPRNSMNNNEAFEGMPVDLISSNKCTDIKKEIVEGGSQCVKIISNRRIASIMENTAITCPNGTTKVLGETPKIVNCPVKDYYRTSINCQQYFQREFTP